MSFNWDEYIGVEPPTVEVPRYFPPQAGTVVGVRNHPEPEAFPEIEVELEGGERVRVANEVFPAVDVATRLWLYPAARGGLQLHDAAWFLDGPGVGVGTEPLRLGDLEEIFVGHHHVLRRLLQEVHADRGSPDTAVSRVKVDEIGQRMQGSPDPALRARARAIGRQVTFGDPVLVRTGKRGRSTVPLYGWESIEKATHQLGVIVDLEGKAVKVGPFSSDVMLLCPDGSVHPNPGLYLYALVKLAERTGPLAATVVSAAPEGIDVRLFGIRHVIPRSGLTWSQTQDLAELFRPDQVIRVVPRPDGGGGLQVRVADGDPPDWLERVTRDTIVLPPSSVEVVDQAGRETRVRVQLELGVVAAGVVLDRWFPTWDESVCLEIAGIDPPNRRLLLVDIPCPDPSRRPLSDDWNVGDVVTGTITAGSVSGFVADVNGLRCLLKVNANQRRAWAERGPQIGEAFHGTVKKLSARRHRYVGGGLLPPLHGDHPQPYPAKPRPSTTSMRATELPPGLEVGQVRRGHVRHIADDFAIVEFDSAKGLLHVSELSWDWVTHPGEVVKLRQEVDVYILSVDRENRKFSVSLKRLTPNPRDLFVQDHPVGSRVLGEVVAVGPHGARVRVAAGVIGFMHVSEMSWTRRPVAAEEIVTVGDTVEVQVLPFDPAKSDIWLSRRLCLKNPWEGAEKRYPLDTAVSGVVRHFVDYGAFVEIEEGIDGLLQVSDMSHTRKVTHPSDLLKVGDVITCLVKAIDVDKQRLTLGLKQLRKDPWAADLPARYRRGLRTFGTVVKFVHFGAFVELEEGLEGLLHLSETRDLPNPDSLGRRIEVVVLRADPDKRKIALSQHLDMFDYYPASFDSLAPFESRVAGPVVDVGPAGLDVELDSGGRGRVSLLETCWERPGPDGTPGVGTRLEALVIGQPRYLSDRRQWVVDLSLRLTLPCPAEENVPPTLYLPGRRIPGTILWVDPLGMWARVRLLEGGGVALVPRSAVPDVPPEEFATLGAGQMVELEVDTYDVPLRQLRVKFAKSPFNRREASPPVQTRPTPAEPRATDAPDPLFERFPEGTRIRGLLQSWSPVSGSGAIALAEGVFGRLQVPPFDVKRFGGRLCKGQLLEAEVSLHATKKREIILKLVRILS